MSVPSSPSRSSRHQVSRSINERISGSTKHTSSSSSSHRHHHHHHHITEHISASLHKKDRKRDEPNGSMVGPISPTTPRGSLEASRSESGFPGNTSPGQSRTGSLLGPAGSDALGMKVVSGPSMEELLLREARKTKARTAGFRKSLHELSTFSTTTSRHLDETYYSVLEKLTTLQNTIVALKDLAHDSTAAKDAFVAEAHGVLAEAQSQLDAFDDFGEHQSRVQALQARVLSGRERIAALSARVDVVRQRVERWERADREWQETTRRRLKIMWGVLLGVGVLLLAVYWGARAYAPELGEVIGELQHDAMAAKVKLDGKAGGMGLGTGKAEENGSFPDVEFSRSSEAVRSNGDEALPGLDEL